MTKEATLKELIRDIPDFPTDGILFRDITPVLKDAAAFKDVIDTMADEVRKMNPDVIIGVESRGFVLGTPIALELGLGFVPVRKLGKLPAETVRADYALEYGTNTVEIHKDGIEPGQRVVIVDDLLATGGTAGASIQLVEELGGVVAGLVFLVELTFLKGRQKLNSYPCAALVRY
jgi:adenine phosphoribosyltransferase